MWCKEEAVKKFECRYCGFTIYKGEVYYEHGYQKICSDCYVDMQEKEADTGEK